MPFDVFFKGLILGFSIAAPVGPIGVLCIRRTLAEGRTIGFVSGLGAATADGFYGAVAAFGLTLISNFLTGQSLWLRLIGGAFLIYLGVTTFLAKPAQAGQAQTMGGTGLLDHPATRLIGAYASTLGLTLTNPATILSFAVIFAGVIGAPVGGLGAGSAGSLVAGVFIGSALWWLTLSVGVGLLRAKFNAGIMVWVNRVSGVIITVFGSVVLMSLLG
jgi:threonine/homoserine/homoserine lactone efflux protein